jgi:hypothetical protein
MAENVKILDGTYQNVIDHVVKNFEFGDERFPLSEKHRELVERWSFADNLLRKNYPNSTIAALISKTFTGRNGETVSIATAYRDIENAKRLFNSMSKENKDYEKILQLEWINKGIKICLEKGDMKSYWAGIRERRLLLGLDKDASGDLTPDVLGGNTTVVQLLIEGKREEFRLDDVSKIPEAVILQASEQNDITNLEDAEIMKLVQMKQEEEYDSE